MINQFDLPGEQHRVIPVVGIGEVGARVDAGLVPTERVQLQISFFMFKFRKGAYQGLSLSITVQLRSQRCLQKKELIFHLATFSRQCLR